jgi:hypothetical protein
MLVQRSSRHLTGQTNRLHDSPTSACIEPVITRSKRFLSDTNGFRESEFQNSYMVSPGLFVDSHFALVSVCERGCESQ